LTEDDIQPQLSRRRPGQSALTTPRDEKDRVEIQSGTEFGYTLGTPIAVIVRNEDQRPHDYSEMNPYPRPSHADYTYKLKYGIKASSGGGRSSARETIGRIPHLLFCFQGLFLIWGEFLEITGRVAAGAIAERYLSLAHETTFVAFVSSVGSIHLPLSIADDASEYQAFLSTLTREQVDSFLPVRCPDKEINAQMEEMIASYRDDKDSIGGTVTCVIRNVPAGLGEPCFDKLEAKLAHAMLSIPATKGFEIGSGFKGCEIRGSKHNDAFVPGSLDPDKTDHRNEQFWRHPGRHF
jgi:chorismate synthase